VDADLDTLLIALYVELDDHIIPAHRPTPRRRGPGRPPAVTDAELICLAIAQVLLRYYDERRWLRAARTRVGHLFPRLLRQSEYNQRLKALAPLMEAALRWLATRTPGTGELLRLMDGTPIGCGQSKITTQRSNLFGYAGYGYETSHSRFYWGAKLMLITTVDGTVTGFGLANPKLMGEREQTRKMLTDQPANVPATGTVVVTDKGLSGQDLWANRHDQHKPRAPDFAYRPAGGVPQGRLRRRLRRSLTRPLTQPPTRKIQQRSGERDRSSTPTPRNLPVAITGRCR
jgi:hypothetical protein